MTITLYHSPGACSTATYISLLESGADFNVEIVSLSAKEQMSEKFTALNPKQKVPFISVDGHGLSENTAIQTWIAGAFPDANLLPKDTFQRARAISYMSWFASGMHPHITRHFKTVKFCQVAEADADIKAKAKAMFLEQMALVEQELNGRPFQDPTWFFDHYTTCDSYFFWIYDRALREGFDLSGFAQCTAHNNAMRERQSTQTVLAHKAN